MAFQENSAMVRYQFLRKFLYSVFGLIFEFYVDTIPFRPIVSRCFTFTRTIPKYPLQAHTPGLLLDVLIRPHTTKSPYFTP
jgi:hypothetical protein